MTLLVEQTMYVMRGLVKMSDVLITKNLNRWFKEKWVDVSRKDKDGKHPPCGRSKAKKDSKGYPKCRPSVKVSGKTPKTSGSMSEGEKRSATKRKRSKKQGVGGKPTIVKSPMDIAMQLLKEFYIDDNNPDTEGFYSPPEHAYGALAELPRNQRMDNLSNYGGDITRLQDKGKYSRGGSQPRLQPSGAFVGARVGIDTDDSDESIQSLGDTLGHEYVHSLIEPEVNEWAEQKHGLLQSQVKPVYQQAQSTEEQRGIRRWARPKGPITNQSELDAEQQRIDLGNQAKTYAHEYGAHQADQASRYAVNSQLAGRPDTQDMYYQYMQPLQPQAMNMLPPMQEQQPEIIQQGEPMDIAFQLLKDAVSPEAKRHKLEYDKKYESSPERVKYREELNRERRKRGIYGHGGPDMSHTKDHTLVAESPHANRARHFKERGTLKG
jgi:hypothetical protein